MVFIIQLNFLQMKHHKRMPCGTLLEEPTILLFIIGKRERQENKITTSP